MPVTARLSKAFYDQLGEQVTNELVEWFNQVDLTYRNDLRALNDTNFARFEAVLDARFTQAEARWAARLDERLKPIDARFPPLEGRLTRLEGQLTRLEGQVTQIFERLTRLEDQLISVRTDFQRELVHHSRWMTGLWITTLLGILGVLAKLFVQDV